MNVIVSGSSGLIGSALVPYLRDQGWSVRRLVRGPAGGGFLAEVCRQWESATQPAVDAGIRVVNSRIGIVLSPTGGALKQVLRPFRLGLGGPLGSGRQWMSWIAIDDLVRAIHHLIET